MTETREGTASDAVVDGSYYFLDMGNEKYGECTLAVFGGVRILIDGGHVGDFEGQQGYRSIPTQLEEILGSPPHDIALLIVTHCHNDHVGCLLDLVRDDVIRPRWALVTHPKLGFGRSVSDNVDARVLRDDPRQRLAALMREEDASDLTDDELRRFIDAATTVEGRYRELMKVLGDKGAKVIQYRGAALPQTLRKALKPSGFQLLGPTEAQLLYCAEQIATTNEDAMKLADRLLAADATLDDVKLYRAAVRNTPEDSRNPRGNGMNCQSITIALGKAGSRALLAGDMQFTEPGVKDADDEVAALRQKVIEAGPYRLFKTTHHTSHNGQDDALLDELGSPDLIIHSGGKRDASHPNPSVLEILKARSDAILFARTDRNGLIEVQPHRDDDDVLRFSRGRLNDFTDNVRDVEMMLAPPPAAVTVTPNGGATQIIIVNLGNGPVDLRVAGVEIVSRVPHPGRTETTSELRPPATHDPDLRVDLAGGRNLPPLLFVTDGAALARNIGRSEARAALEAVKRRRYALLEIAGARDPVAKVREALVARRAFEGVVLLGGYDVVPSIQVDVLGRSLRRQLGAHAEIDNDDFIVWSDEPYGDYDGDRIGEVPVSRVPDGRDSALFLRALQADGPGTPGRFGVRNVARPFADSVWGGIGGAQPLEVSEEFLAHQVNGERTATSFHYFMLHGDHRDAQAFWGETDSGQGYTRAFDLQGIPKSFRGIVFTGCCWGALTVANKASELTRDVAPRSPEQSIALTYLKAGANAFVGCTGAHYSGPDLTPDENYAVELHQLFWDALQNGAPGASAALFSARRGYGASIANRAREPIDVARRLKNRAQFTCLGLGW